MIADLSKDDAKEFMTLFLSIIDAAEDVDEVILAAQMAMEMRRAGVKVEQQEQG